MSRGLGEGALNIGKAAVTAPVRAVDTFVQGGNNIGQVIVDVQNAGGLQNYMEPIASDPLTAATLPLQVNLQMATDAATGIYGVVTSGDPQTIANASVDLGLGILAGKLAPTSPATATTEVVTQESRALAGTAAADVRGVASAPKAKLAPEVDAAKPAVKPVEKLSKVEKSKTVEQIGDGKYTKTTEVRPGIGPGQSRSEYVRIKDAEGKTIKTYKDSYDRANKFQHRKPLRGGPEGRKPNED